MLINVVGILILMRMIDFMLSFVEHVKVFLNLHDKSYELIYMYPIWNFLTFKSN